MINQMIKENKIYNEDCLDTMAKMPDNFVDLIITSPPYDNLRIYKDNGNTFKFEQIAKELYRVTAKGGIVVWVVGDGTIKGSETGTSFKQALYFKDEVGFRLHDTMIYQKANFSNPSSNRYHQIFEYMFVFSKGKPKTFNPIKDRKNIGKMIFGQDNTIRQKDGSMKTRKWKKYADYGMRYNIWRMNTVGQENPCTSNKHPAMFPEALANDHILSWTNKGDLVYDPLLGSGTVAKMALINDRKFIGSEISKEYCKLAEERIKDYI